jgi:hypothetical protein
MGKKTQKYRRQQRTKNESQRKESKCNDAITECKKQNNQYTQEERQAQTDVIKTKIEELGLSVYTEETEKLYNMFDDFVTNGTEFDEQILIRDEGRRFNVTLYNNIHQTISVTIEKIK